MDLDQISTQAEQLASRLGVLTPRAESGRTPDWCADGVLPRIRKGRPVLIIGPAFDSLSPMEQQGVLAEAMLSVDLQWVGRYKPLIAVVLLVLVPYLALSVFAAEAIMSRMASWQWGLLGLTAYIVGLVVTRIVWARHIIYALDRRMIEAFGRDVVDVMFDLDDRSRARARGLLGVLVKCGMPDKARRAERLGADQ
ncbi:hypothetical protein [Nocardia sp. NPDC056000]|uniref:hypothetical protein n=1 Tax=Nocardia sp. NPDC056000 TaxID=3345674 RepID=UPI0035D7E902